MSIEQEQRALEARERLAKYQADPITEEIDGIVYTSEKFPADQALEILGRLGRVLGGDGLRLIVLGSGSLASVFASARGNAQFLDSLSIVLSNMLADLPLVTRVLSKTRCNKLRPAGGEGYVVPHFGSHFKGEIPHLVGVLHFVLSHNFAGFTLGFPSPDGSRTNAETGTETPSL